MQKKIAWRRIRFVARYLIVVIPGGFFLAPLAFGFLLLLIPSPLFCAAIVVMGGIVGWATSRYCPKPEGFRLRYGPLFALILVPVLTTIAIMAISDGGSKGPWILPVFTSPAFFLALLVEFLEGPQGLPLTPLAPSLYALAYGAGFFGQEWRAGDAFKIARPVFGAMALLSLAMVVSGSVMSMRRDDTFVPRNYSFAYAGGFSSTDLAPYELRRPDNILPVLSDPSTFRVEDKNKMPVLDGAEAAFPLYAAFAKACYAKLTVSPLPTEEKFKGGADPYDDVVAMTNTINAFKRLVRGDVDIVFGAEPSAEQRKFASQAGEELVLTPIGQEAFVFFVNENNPVSSLSTEQIRKIYQGEIRNWKELGGDDMRIMAFQRPDNSGSQTVMLRFMEGEALMRPLKEERVADMGGIIEKTADYYNAPGAIGYSFRFFVKGMRKSEGVRLLALDGVSPEPANIQSGAYPFVTKLYAIVLKKNPKPEVALFLQWMQGPQGQELVEKVGYSPLAQQ